MFYVMLWLVGFFLKGLVIFYNWWLCDDFVNWIKCGRRKCLCDVLIFFVDGRIVGKMKW